MMMLTTVNVQLTYLFFSCPLYCMPHFVHIYIPDVHMYGVSVSLILHHGLVADVVCTSSMTMLTTVIVQLTYLFFYVSALLYALFLHIYEPDVDIFAVPVSPILHLGLVADVFRTTSMTMLTTVIVQLTYLFFTCPLYCMLLFVHI